MYKDHKFTWHTHPLRYGKRTEALKSAAKGLKHAASATLSAYSVKTKSSKSTKNKKKKKKETKPWRWQLAGGADGCMCATSELLML